MSNKFNPFEVWVGSIPTKASKEKVKECFEKIGLSVESVRLPPDKSNKKLNRGFGFVVFRSELHAERCLETCNGMHFLGSRLTVKQSQTDHIAKNKRVDPNYEAQKKSINLSLYLESQMMSEQSRRAAGAEAMQKSKVNEVATMKEEYNATLRTENDLSSEIEALEENKRGDVDITAANNIASNRSLTAPAACVFNQQPTKKKQKLDDGWKKNACLDNNTESETDEPNPNPNKKTSSLDHDELELVDVSDSDISDDGPPTDTRVKSHGLTVPCDDKLVLKSKDVNKMQFRMVAWAKESHGKQIYSVSWSPDVHSAKGAGENSTNEYDVVRYGASCAGRYITVYECRNSTQDRTTSEQRMDISREDADTEPCDLRPIQLYFDLDPDEIFYICAWGGRGSNHTIVNPFATDQSQAVKDEKISSQPIPLGTDRVRKAVNMKNYDGPKLLCAAGHSGIVKVIDTTRKMLLFSLVGHGDEIYDMKFCRTNDWLLLTASKDESLRLWNIQIPSCLAIFAGEKGHRDCVLSCDFNPIGNYFISSSMDTTIKIWSLETNEIKHAIKKSFELVGEDSSCLKTVTESFPCFSTNQAHNNYVDCVQYVGGHLILSKSVEHVIVLWKPVFEQTKAVAEAPSGIYPLREFRLNRCDLWFMRFHTYESIEGGGFVLAAGNNIGEIKLWDIFGRSNGLLKNNFAKLTTSQCTSAARMVKFSPCGKSLLVGCDDGMLYKWQLI